MKMTVDTFKYIRNMIKNDPNAVKTNWFDGHKWTDKDGNWYGWTDCGWCEYIYYNGEKWSARTDASGEMMEPEKED